MSTRARYETIRRLTERGPQSVRLVCAPPILGHRARYVIREITATALQDGSGLSARIQTTSRLRHPALIRVDGAVQTADGYGLLTEFVSGCALEEALEAGPLPFEVTRRIGAQLVDALVFLHSGSDGEGQTPHCHGSVTPDKVLLGRQGEVKLVDFGTSEVSVRAVVGFDAWPLAQRPWIPPETPEWGTPEGDAFMLGATLYAALIGRAPSPPGRQLTEAVWRTLDYPPEVPADLVEFVHGCLDPRPEGRPPIASALASSWIQGSRPGPVSHFVRWFCGESEDLPIVREPARTPIERMATEIVYDEPPSNALVLSPSASRMPAPLPRPVFAPAPPTVDFPDRDDMREQVRLIWAEPLEAMVESHRARPALPAGKRAAEATASTRAAATYPIPGSWIRPAGVLMGLCAALVLTWIQPPARGPGTLEIRGAASEIDINGKTRARLQHFLTEGTYRVGVPTEGGTQQIVSARIRPGERTVLVLFGDEKFLDP